ncbi:MAG: type II toxin-antitoxin system RelE family toxin, partial [Dolichospermum sp.]
RFLLVTLEDIQAESLPGTSEELPSWEELINYFSQVSKLIENNNIEPAFLFLWSVFEGALRKRAVDVSIPVESLPAIKLIKSMYSLGELSISEFDIIQACLEQRNRLAHGYIQKLDSEVLYKLVTLVVKLLIEWTSNISETESKNQQVNKNEIILDDNAQIALDALPTQEKEKISYAISCLENFPDCSEIEFSNLNSSPDNDFIAKVGIYRIIFEVQSKKVTITDIVNYKRIEMLYGLLEKAKV